MKNHFLKSLLALSALTFPMPAIADDIELFAGLGSSGDAPNVVLVLDNAANFSANVATMRCSITAGGVVKTDGTGTAPTNLDGTAGAVEQCALYAALQALETSAVAKINIGVMGFNANGMKQFNPATNTFSSACVGGTGGCLLMPLTEFNAANKTNILNWIRNWAISGGSDYVIKGSNSANGAVMQETWAYFYGKMGVSGRDYSGVAPTASCANKYTIFIGNAYRNNATPGDGTNEANSPWLPLNGTSANALKRADPPATQAQKDIITGTIATYCGTSTLQTAEGRGVYALNWARYMKAQGVTTYSIGVLGPTCNAEYAAHLTRLGAADVGGGKYFATTDFAELKAAIETAVSEIQSVNSAFASVSLPVSVNTQGTYLNQVYVGMFRPAENFRPRWPGNLKQYRMGIHNGELKLLDAEGTGTPAISSSGSGFIAECARSYWTPTADDTYWGTTFEDANCSPHPASSNTPDGNIVEKGAQGYKLRGSPTATSISRNIKTCSNAACDSLENFDQGSAIVSKTALGDAGMSDTDRINLINWARGLNNKGDEVFVAATTMRPSSHGDVVHSRPVAINFGSDASPQVMVFYGGNDGMLRAINGNRDGGANIGSADPGSEVWSFVPSEFYGKFKRLREDAIPISYPDSGVSIEQPKDYGFDGPITAHKVDAGHAWIYASMRRGGRAIYAFDVNVATPDDPTLKWKKTYTDTGFDGLGQTWSSAKVLKSAHDAGASPMLIVGGGYDACEDTEAGTANHSCTALSKGNHIYVLDADDGTLLKTLTLPKALAADPNRGIVADITIVTDLATGLAKYAYAADLGGNIYRITIGNAAPADWTIIKVASLGCPDAGTCAANRKFMFAPDVVEENGIYMLLVGSGDREKPLGTYTATTGVQNYFFMVKDKPSDPTWLSSESPNCSASVICMASLSAISSNPSQSTLDASKGWYLDMRASEQVVTSAITLYGVVTFSSHMPAVYSPGACSSTLGAASVYNIHYLDASSANGTDSPYQNIVGGGLPPSPVAGMVTLDSYTTVNEDGETVTVPGQTVPFVIGANPNSPLESKLGGGGVASSVSEPKVRVYWYIQQ